MPDFHLSRPTTKPLHCRLHQRLCSKFQCRTRRQEKKGKAKASVVDRCNADHREGSEISRFLSTKERVLFVVNVQNSLPCPCDLERGEVGEIQAWVIVGHSWTSRGLFLRLWTGPKEWLDSKRVKRAADVKSLLCS